LSDRVYILVQYKFLKTVRGE